MENTEIIGPHLHGPCVTYSVYEGIGRQNLARFYKGLLWTLSRKTLRVS